MFVHFMQAVVCISVGSGVFYLCVGQDCEQRLRYRVLAHAEFRGKSASSVFLEGHLSSSG